MYELTETKNGEDRRRQKRYIAEIFRQVVPEKVYAEKLVYGPVNVGEPDFRAHCADSGHIHVFYEDDEDVDIDDTIEEDAEYEEEELVAETAEDDE